jgi:long-subunit fatty acid transport protein
LLLTALLSTLAQAASLDLVEVGGLWGTPGATDATAVYWNPAGLAVGGGTSFVVEGAPTFATVTWDRPAPDYGAIDRDADGVPDGETYDYGGTQELKFSAVVPFIGASSDFGVKNLGVGAAFYIPYARSGTSQDPDGFGRYQIREGGITTLQGTLAAAYDLADKVSVGAGVSVYHNIWDVSVDTEAVTALRDATAELLGNDPIYWQDADTENPGYATTLDFDALNDTGVTFNAGLVLHPKERWSLAVSYVHGAKLVNTGTVDLTFQCPPATDTFGTLGAQLYGLCDDQGNGATMQGDASVGYQLPGRVQGGFVVLPAPRLRLELMGAFVMWSAFSDYEITTTVAPDQVSFLEGNADGQAETADLVSQDRQWARDNRDTFWVGVDAKGRVHKRVTVGGRVLFDHSAIPSSAVSTNNLDADTLSLSGLGVVHATRQLGIGLSYGYQAMFTRTVTDSAFALDMQPDQRNEDRYFWPIANGTYGGGIHRIGVSLKGQFGGAGADDAG